jgi:DNA segregation ATPase FtsK/SpoIIIE, S-DNA-T family
MKQESYLATGCFAAGAFFLACSLFSYSPHDLSPFFMTSEQVQLHNWCGIYGSVIASWLLYLCGWSAWFMVLWLAMVVAKRVYGWNMRAWALLLLVPIGVTVSAFAHVEFYQTVVPGGYFGRLFLTVLRQWFDEKMLVIVLVASLWMLAVLVLGFWWVRPVYRTLCSLGSTQMLRLLFKRVYQVVAWGAYYMGYPMQYAYATVKDTGKKLFSWGRDAEKPDAFDQAVFDTLFWQQQSAQDAIPVIPSENKNLSLQTYTQPEHAYVIPDISLLPRVKHSASSVDKDELHVQARILEEKLRCFGIKGTVVAITAGPVVTLFEYQPEIDTPISKILAREDDLTLALHAMSLRIIAPIPGKSVVGFEVSHAQRLPVLFADCVQSAEFRKIKEGVPLVLGQNTVGMHTSINLASLPHLLVAGSTGSGKSVALHSMIMSILCSQSPNQVKCILIDPKRLEFAAYADIPHLLFPVVTDAKEAIAVLRWAVQAMEERYQRMADAGARNMFEYRMHTDEPLPYIVIVIDELADLMMIAGKEVEELVARLAQMARAAGIHMIIATQRPSVDVITGVIKINFPARVACKVISKVDSRTILDVAGAEKLLGMGDMLFLDAQGAIMRVHGAYVSDEEIRTIVAYAKSQQAVAYEVMPEIETKLGETTAEDLALYEELLAFVKTIDEVSISMIQRRFRIGYNRSARMIEMLESRGVVLPASGSKLRKVLH